MHAWPDNDEQGRCGFRRACAAMEAGVIIASNAPYSGRAHGLRGGTGHRAEVANRRGR